MLHDEFKKHLESYLAAVAVQNEEVLKNYAALQVANTYEADIALSKYALERTHTSELKANLLNALKTLEEKQKQQKKPKDVMPLQALVAARTGSIDFVLPLTKEAIKMDSAKEIGTYIQEVVENYAPNANVQVKNNYLVLHADVLELSFVYSQFLRALSNHEPKIHCEGFGLETILETGAAADVKSQAKPAKKEPAKKAEYKSPEKKQKSLEAKASGANAKISGELAQGESGYFTIEEAANALGKGQSTIHAWINLGYLPKKKMHMPGHSKKIRVVPYTALLNTCKANGIERPWKNDDVISDLAEGHSDIYILASHGIPEKELRKLKKQLGTENYTGKGDDSAKEHESSQSDDGIRQFFKKHGITNAAYEKAKKQFPKVHWRVIAGHMSALKRWGKK